MKKLTAQNFHKVLAGAQVMMANEIGQIGSLSMPQDIGEHNRPGIICMANETRFNESYFSEPLTGYALGWSSPPGLREALAFVAPDVLVPRKFQFAKATNAEAFLSEADDLRAIGGGFKIVEFTSAKANDITYNKGLTVRVDLDNVDGMANWREIYTARLMERLIRNDLRRGLTLLSAAATNTAKTWGTTQDPDEDVRDAVNAYGDAVGINPTRLLYDLGAGPNGFGATKHRPTQAGLQGLR
jgi:hypothetical protein